MLSRVSWGVAGAVLLLTAAAVRSRANDAPIRFVPTIERAVTGSYLVKWEDDYDGTTVHEGPLPSLTWYYSAHKDGRDRKRMTTIFRDDFRHGYRLNWRPEQPNVFDWKIGKDERRGISFFSGRIDAGPALSDELPRRDIVISALVRPRGMPAEFALGGRVQGNGAGYEIRGAGDAVRVVAPGHPRPLRRCPIPALDANTWYWYEFGVRTRKKKEVEIRVQIFDEKREKLLCWFPAFHRPQNGDLLKEGRISLWGHADFAEICVDPWAARWIEDDENRFEWDTSKVSDGDYYLVAEIVDCKGRRIVVSPFKVEVRNPRRSDSD